MVKSYRGIVFAVGAVGVVVVVVGEKAGRGLAEVVAGPVAGGHAVPAAHRLAHRLHTVRQQV